MRGFKHVAVSFCMTMMISSAVFAADTHLILIGDSRTEGMAEAVGSAYQDETIQAVNHWCYKSSEGLNHMLNVSFPFVEQTIQEIHAEDPEAEINVVCMYGVNDPHNVHKYCAAYNQLAETCLMTGTKSFFVSVNPIADEKSGYKYDKDAYVTAFNETLKPNLSDHVTYIDTYSQIADIFRPYTRDGVHYKADMYRFIYRFILNNIMESRNQHTGGNND